MTNTKKYGYVLKLRQIPLLERKVTCVRLERIGSSALEICGNIKVIPCDIPVIVWSIGS